MDEAEELLKELIRGGYSMIVECNGGFVEVQRPDFEVDAYLFSDTPNFCAEDAEENVSTGLSLDEALRRAYAVFGNGSKNFEHAFREGLKNGMEFLISPASGRAERASVNVYPRSGDGSFDVAYWGEAEMKVVRTRAGVPYPRRAWENWQANVGTIDTAWLVLADTLPALHDRLPIDADV